MAASPPEGFDPAFHATFTDWNADNATLDAADTVDTLVLTWRRMRCPRAGMAVWTFDGSVYKSSPPAASIIWCCGWGSGGRAFDGRVFGGHPLQHVPRGGRGQQGLHLHGAHDGHRRLSLQVSVDGQTYSPHR